jgi:hypothetical protein
MTAYDPRLDGEELTLDRTPTGFVDRQTGSRWTIEGLAVEGTHSGRRLAPVRSFQIRWHALAYCHREARVWTCPELPPRFGAHDPNVTEPFEPALAHLAGGGHDVSIEGPVISQRRPRESLASLTIRVDGHRVNLHRMASERAARDYEAFEGAVSGWPVRERAIDFRVRRVGRLIVESDPDRRFADPAQVVRLPYRSIDWAPVLDAPVLDTLAPDGHAEEPGGRGFLDIVRSLRVAGFEVMEVGFLTPGQLRVGCENAIALTIDGDRFLLYRFGSVEAAEAYVATEPHARAVEGFVIRSTPPTMYVFQPNEIAFAGEGWVRWSSLMSEPRFLGALRSAVADADTVNENPRQGRDDLVPLRPS